MRNGFTESDSGSLSSSEHVHPLNYPKAVVCFTKRHCSRFRRLNRRALFQGYRRSSAKNNPNVLSRGAWKLTPPQSTQINESVAAIAAARNAAAKLHWA